MRPYRRLVISTLLLTLVGSLAAQVSPFVLRYTVDTVQGLARLFLKNLPLIFLDEPTANLDAIATGQIKNSPDASKQGRTVVIISHRRAQIVDADRNYVLKKGEMVESGTHLELYEKRGTYREIFDASARSLNIEKLAKTTADDGGEVLDTAL